MFHPSKNTSREEQWIYISDLMAGLMVIFLFLSLLLLSNFNQKANKYDRITTEICEELKKTFSENYEEWGMDICKGEGIGITFKRGKSYFKLGKSDLSPVFRNILNKFKPDLLQLLVNYKSSIIELRIEGYADNHGFKNSIIEYCSESLLFLNDPNVKIGEKKLNKKIFAEINKDKNKFQPKERLFLMNNELKSNVKDCLKRVALDENGELPKEIARKLNYLKNTSLSLDRSQSVLRHIMAEEYSHNETESPPYNSWKDIIITAHGFSSSKLADSDSESRRVEFRIVTKEEKEVIEAAKQLGRTSDE